jgi:hypothetical protein
MNLHGTMTDDDVDALAADENLGRIGLTQRRSMVSPVISFGRSNRTPSRTQVAGLPQFGTILESESQQISQQPDSENVVAFAR